MIELPDFVIKVLTAMGVPGAIIAVLLIALSGAVTTIGLLLRHASKVYGYRLAERDRLNEALSKSADVLKDLLEVTEERNDLTSEQAELLKAQTAAFELLRVTITSQFDKIEQNHDVAMDAYKVSRDVVGSMADGLRTLHTMIVDNRGSFAEHINGVRVLLQDSRNAIEAAVSQRHETSMSELRRISNSLSNDVTIIERKRRVQDTRPNKKS